MRRVDWWYEVYLRRKLKYFIPHVKYFVLNGIQAKSLVFYAYE